MAEEFIKYKYAITTYNKYEVKTMYLSYDEKNGYSFGELDNALLFDTYNQVEAYLLDHFKAIKYLSDICSDHFNIWSVSIKLSEGSCLSSIKATNDCCFSFDRSGLYWKQRLQDEKEQI